MMRICICLCMICYGQFLFAQQINKTIDSLLNKLATSKFDTNRVDIYNELGFRNTSAGNITAAKLYLDSAFALATKLKYPKGLSVASRYMGGVFHNQANYPEAMKQYKAALKIAEDIRDKSLIAKCLRNMGIVLAVQGDREGGLKYYQDCLKIAEEINDKELIATTHTSIGNIYNGQGKYRDAIKEFEEAYKIQKEFGF